MSRQKDKRKGGRKRTGRDDSQGERTLSPPQEETLEIIRQELSLRGYTEEDIGGAEQIWIGYCLDQDPKIRRPEIHAAAVEYLVSVIATDSPPSQAALARHYGVGASSLSKAYRKLVETPPPPPPDPTLSSPPEPAREVGGRAGSGDAPSPHGDRDQLKRLMGSQMRRLVRRLPTSDETWVGGRRSMESFVLKPEPFRPDLCVWVEQRSELVLAAMPFNPKEGLEAVLRSLVEAMTKPMVGGPRRPSQVRLDDPELVDQLEGALRAVGIDVRAGTPATIDGVVDAINTAARSDADDRKLTSSYLDGGRISKNLIERFFRSTARLLRSSPWSYAEDRQVLEVHLDRWQRDQLCVSIIGSAGLDRGLLLFDSMEDFLSYYEMAEAAVLTGKPPTRIGVRLLSINFDRPSDLGQSCLKEVLTHGWEVESADSYPWLLKIGPDAAVEPLTENDYRVASACADAVAAFVSRHKRAFSRAGRLLTHTVPLPGWPEAPPVSVVGPHLDL